MPSASPIPKNLEFTYPPPLSQQRHLWISPHSRLARDVIYGSPHIRTWDVELNLTKNLDYFFFQIFVTYVIRYSWNLQVVSSFILFEMIPINLIWHEIIFKIIYFDAQTLSYFQIK